MKRTFLVTRPRIASELIKHGLEFEIISHPWKPNLTAWVFDLTDDDNAQLVESVYSMFGLNPPRIFDAVKPFEKGVQQ